MKATTMQRAVLLTMCAALSGVVGCVAAVDEEEGDGPEVTAADDDAITGSGSVEHAMQNSCSTGSVKGLSLQIIQEARCTNPDAYEKLPSLGNLHLGPNVFPYLEKPAHDHLVSALKAHPTKSFHVDSMLRTIAQQYLLYHWYLNGRCGIPLAATPGNSNHETGLAFDTSDHTAWKSILSNHGFHWLGSSDPAHFDYAGAGASDHRGLDVKAFQRLWNRNHPNDKITVDGDWGPQTEARMKKAPAAGFAKGPSCQ